MLFSLHSNFTTICAVVIAHANTQPLDQIRDASIAADAWRIIAPIFGVPLADANAIAAAAASDGRYGSPEGGARFSLVEVCHALVWSALPAPHRPTLSWKLLSGTSSDGWQGSADADPSVSPAVAETLAWRLTSSRDASAITRRVLPRLRLVMDEDGLQMTALGLLEYFRELMLAYASTPPRLTLDEYVKLLDEHGMYRNNTVRLREVETGRAVGRPKTATLSKEQSLSAFMLSTGIEGEQSSRTPRTMPACMHDTPIPLRGTRTLCGRSNVEVVTAWARSPPPEAHDRD